MREKLQTLPLAELKEMAKNQGIKGISALRKAEIIDLLCKEAESNPEVKPAEVKKEEKPEPAPQPEVLRPRVLESSDNRKTDSRSGDNRHGNPRVYDNKFGQSKPQQARTYSNNGGQAASSSTDSGEQRSSRMEPKNDALGLSPQDIVSWTAESRPTESWKSCPTASDLYAARTSSPEIMTSMWLRHRFAVLT